MRSLPNPPTFPPQPWFDPKTGNALESFRRFLAEALDSANTRITNVNSGLNQAFEAANTRIDTEIGSRIVGDDANAGTGDGTAVSDSRVYSSKTTSGATWVTLVTCMVTPSAAGGGYTFTFTAATDLGHISDEGVDGVTFNGNWRIVEEDVGTTDTPVTIDSGTFSVTYIAEQVIEIEGPDDPTIPEGWAVVFSDLPSGPIANTYDGVVAHLRFDIQRASGSNEITAPGFSGTFRTDWAA